MGGHWEACWALRLHLCSSWASKTDDTGLHHLGGLLWIAVIRENTGHALLQPIQKVLRPERPTSAQQIAKLLVVFTVARRISAPNHDERMTRLRLLGMGYLPHRVTYRFGGKCGVMKANEFLLDNGDSSSRLVDTNQHRVAVERVETEGGIAHEGKDKARRSIIFRPGAVGLLFPRATSN